MQPVLEELYQRVEEIGNEPRNEEGEQSSAQEVEQPKGSDGHEGTQKPPDETVECYLLFQHKMKRLLSVCKSNICIPNIDCRLINFSCLASKVQELLNIPRFQLYSVVFFLHLCFDWISDKCKGWEYFMLCLLR